MPSAIVGRARKRWFVPTVKTPNEAEQRQKLTPTLQTSGKVFLIAVSYASGCSIAENIFVKERVIRKMRTLRIALVPPTLLPTVHVGKQP
jgi:hypothetical protein